MSTQAIGLFDSGVGGTSIWKEIHKLLPYENTIYLADSANAPYGQKSKEEIIHLSEKNTEFLLEKNVKIIVVACNTATTNAIKELRSKYQIPFIGIEPAIKPAALNSQTQTIGILATKGTINSELFSKAVQSHKNVKIIEQIGHNLVPLIENGMIESAEMRELLKIYLNPMIEQNIDYLVLGCSHYPYLIPVIKEILPTHIQIIDSGEAVAKQTRNVLEQNNLLVSDQKPTLTFYTNKNGIVLKSLLNSSEAVIIEQNF
ncbi:glutamate racemase [Flavobacterium aurantiibacter]|uniref:Glutamate racemase n=1 Tax=Flavobacterium aurantiibacter TaxID=2023067 RepID=A0A255ZIZ3_9FLAO|nr:glutamate racemase [Flavobacterium aurantiibacter]OYQ41513.1 glutamate racemase [Flavobacterium aurantiibacter]